MAWFLITLRCSAGHTWQRRTKNPASADPPCPILDCASRNGGFSRGDRGDQPPMLETAPGPDIGMDFASNRAPGIIGTNVHVKAIDETAKIVMEDYGHTDMRDDVRPGETMAPKLPPAQQAAADNYFGGGRKRELGGVNLARHARAAMAGALVDPGSTNRSIGSVHAARVRPPVHIVAQTRQ